MLDDLEVCVQQFLDTIEHANSFEELLLTEPEHVMDKDGFGFWWDCYFSDTRWEVPRRDGLELFLDFFAEPITESIHGFGTRKIWQATLRFSGIKSDFKDKIFEDTPFTNLTFKITKRTLLKAIEERKKTWPKTNCSLFCKKLKPRICWLKGSKA